MAVNTTNSTTVLVISHSESDPVFDERFNTNDPWQFSESMKALGRRLASENYNGQNNTLQVTLLGGGTLASGVLTLTGNPSNNQTLVLSGVTFTAKSGGNGLTLASTSNMASGVSLTQLTTGGSLVQDQVVTVAGNQVTTQNIDGWQPGPVTVSLPVTINSVTAGSIGVAQTLTLASWT